MATKERRKTPPGAPKYHRLTDEKRIIIEALRKEGCSKKHIAERVGCHPTTVWRELKRNVSKKGYRHKKADQDDFGEGNDIDFANKPKPKLL